MTERGWTCRENYLAAFLTKFEPGDSLLQHMGNGLLSFEIEQLAVRDSKKVNENYFKRIMANLNLLRHLDGNDETILRTCSRETCGKPCL